MSSALKTKIQALLEYLNHGLVERDATLKAALLAVLAGENMLLVGPPGTAKSFIARRVAESLAHEGHAAPGYFEYLLTKFSTPEEIFGPLSISELKADRFKRNTAGYLPTVRVAFLDEIFKASSSILNSLLTILNERIYHNGAEAQPVPMQALIAASNELPTGQEELEALYDRFLVRNFVDYISADNLPRLFDKPGIEPALTPLAVADLAAIRQAAEAVTLPDEVIAAIQRIWAEHKEAFKEDRRERLSDRRLKKAVGLLRVSAATNGRSEIDLSDLLLLKDCLWNHPENAPKLHKILLDTLRRFSRPVPLNVAESENAEIVSQESVGHHKSAPSKKLFKDYEGAGTADDPILIKDVHDLSGLERPEVGQQGLYFRQTADIDCSGLSSWPSIRFQGHYDGAGFDISQSSKTDDYPNLFAVAQAKSSLSNMRLNNVVLANTANDCVVIHCASNTWIVRTASDCKIQSCEGLCMVGYSASACKLSRCMASGYLVEKNADNCEITECITERGVIGRSATSCTIQDCQADLKSSFGTGSVVNCAGVAQTLEQSSVVERCFVSGQIEMAHSNNLVFSPVAMLCDASIVRQSAFGAFSFTGSGKVYCTLRGRILKEVKGTVSLENNIALDCHSGTSDPSGTDGKSISAAQFTQRYFEHTLGWDFERVWQWNDQKSTPELRHVGVNAVQHTALDVAPEPGQSDLLTEQLRANLWL